MRPFFSPVSAEESLPTSLRVQPPSAFELRQPAQKPGISGPNRKNPQSFPPPTRPSTEPGTGPPDSEEIHPQPEIALCLRLAWELPPVCCDAVMLLTRLQTWTTPRRTLTGGLATLFPKGMRNASRAGTRTRGITKMWICLRLTVSKAIKSKNMTRALRSFWR